MLARPVGEGGAGQQAGLGPEQLGRVDSAQSLCGAQGLWGGLGVSRQRRATWTAQRPARQGATAWSAGAPRPAYHSPQQGGGPASTQAFM